MRGRIAAPPPRARRAIWALPWATVGVLALAFIHVSTTVAFDCKSIDTGPAECKPLTLKATGPLQVTVSVGSCTWQETPTVQKDASARLSGGGENRLLAGHPPAAGNPLVPSRTINVPAPGRYTLTVRTNSQSGNDPSAYSCYYGVS